MEHITKEWRLVKSGGSATCGTCEDNFKFSVGCFERAIAKGKVRPDLGATGLKCAECEALFALEWIDEKHSNSRNETKSS